jgi:hypothetical protein
MSAIVPFHQRSVNPGQQPGFPASSQLIEAAQGVLLQGLGLLFDLGDHTYSTVARAPFSASIGQHYRHILEHFHCLIRGARAGEVNYDARERNQRLESEVSYASVSTCDVLRAIKKWNEASLQSPSKVVSSVSYGATAPEKIASNVGRELSYCVAHAIHHYAIIRLICAEQGIEVSADFGYAPSTVKHLSSLAAD